MPTPDNNIAVPAFDANKIKPFQDVSKALLGNKTATIKMTASNVRGPIALNISHADFYGVLMPMAGPELGEVPSWM